MKQEIIILGIASSLIFLAIAHILSIVIEKLTGDSRYKKLVYKVLKVIVPGCIILIIFLLSQT